jgi:hypothetical protein
MYGERLSLAQSIPQEVPSGGGRPAGASRSADCLDVWACTTPSAATPVTLYVAANGTDSGNDCADSSSLAPPLSLDQPDRAFRPVCVAQNRVFPITA